MLNERIEALRALPMTFAANGKEIPEGTREHEKALERLAGSLLEVEFQGLIDMARKTAAKAKPKKLKKDDPEQSKLFEQTAREIGADESGRAFKKALKKMTPAKSAPKK